MQFFSAFCMQLPVDEAGWPGLALFYGVAAIRQHLMLPAWVEKAAWSTGQGVNLPAGWRNDTAGRIKWKTVNKEDIPVLFVHYKPGSPWLWMTQPWLNNPKMGDVSSAGKGAGKSHCPGDLPLAAHTAGRRRRRIKSWVRGRKMKKKRNEEIKFSFMTHTPTWRTVRGHGGLDPITFRNIFAFRPVTL